MEDNKFVIVFIDIETAPCLGWTWQKYETTVLEFEKNTRIISFSVKYAGSKKVEVYALPDFPLYKEDPESDRELVRKIWQILDGADLVIGHNSDKFDLPKINARFMLHGFPPPSPYKTVDTLKVARKHFAFESNKLSDLCRFLNIGRKVKTGGFDLWMECIKEGSAAAWKRMKQYNAHDVDLLEALYNRFRGWITTHPNVAVKNSSDKAQCPNCGSEKLQRRGYQYIRCYRAQRFQCQNCSRWSTGTKEKLEQPKLA